MNRQKLAALALAAFLLSGSPAWCRIVHRRMRMEATAFDRHAITAAGTIPHEGIVAADPSVLPLGTRIRVSGAGIYSGIYTVRDTGGKVVGRHIDIYVPDLAAARTFGKKLATVRVLKIGTQEAPTGGNFCGGAALTLRAETPRSAKDAKAPKKHFFA